MFRSTPLLRELSQVSSRRTAAALTPLRRPYKHIQPCQRRQAHAISNPTLANIEKRWEGMPPQEQADLWMALRDRMKVDWTQMTMQEKKAAYWIAFGPHGPRAGTPPGEGTKVFLLTAACIATGVVLFWVVHQFARAPPKTMTKEWQEASNEYLKEARIEPISGVSSEGYKGPGMVQSPPGLKEEDDDE